MKKVLLLFCCSFIFCFAFSQSAFDKSLDEVSVDIAGKLLQKDIKRVVVLFVTDASNSPTVMGKYIADNVSFNFINHSNNFIVIRRENLSGVIEAKKLIEEGFIDAAKAKELGKILAVDAIIIGNYVVLSNTLKLTIEALDVNSGSDIAASRNILPIDKDASALLGITVGTGGGNNTANRGHNGQPINSNEVYNNEATVDSKCEKYGFGNYCFTNSTRFRVHVYLQNGTEKALNKLDPENRPMYYTPNPYFLRQVELTLEPNQTQCIYELKPATCNYSISIESDNRFGGRELKGEIYVEKCRSKTFIIK